MPGAAACSVRPCNPRLGPEWPERFSSRGHKLGVAIIHRHERHSPAFKDRRHSGRVPETRWRLSEEIGFFDANGCRGTCHIVERELEASARIVRAGMRFVTIAQYASWVALRHSRNPQRH